MLFWCFYFLLQEVNVNISRAQHFIDLAAGRQNFNEILQDFTIKIQRDTRGLINAFDPLEIPKRVYVSRGGLSIIQTLITDMSWNLVESTKSINYGIHERVSDPGELPWGLDLITICSTVVCTQYCMYNGHPIERLLYDYLARQ